MSKLELIFLENGTEYTAQNDLNEVLILSIQKYTATQFFTALHEFKNWDMEKNGKVLVNLENEFAVQNRHKINAIFGDWMIDNGEYFLEYHSKNEILQIMERYSVLSEDDFFDPEYQSGDEDEFFDPEDLAAEQKEFNIPLVLLLVGGITIFSWMALKKK